MESYIFSKYMGNVSPYEFGNKIGLVTHVTQKIVLAVKAFPGNPHDSKTIAPLLEQLAQTGQPLPP